MSTESSAVLVAHLARFRRRAALVMFVRSLVMVSSASLTIAGAAVLLNLLTASAAFSAAAASAVVAAAIVTILQRPTQRATAATVDRRLELHDRVVTALQCASLPDAFSRLVVRDAISWLSNADAAAAFPMRLPRMAAAGPVAIACAMVVLAALPSMRGFSSGGGALAARVGSAAQPSTARSAVSRQVDAPAVVVSSGRPVTASHAAASKDIKQSASQLTASAEAAGGSRSSLRTDAGDALAAAHSEAPPDGRGVAAPDGSPSSESRLAGGVTGASESRQTTREAPLPDGRAYGAAYRAGVRAAETAIVQDRIPAERRAYVRAYFDAIRPQAGK